MKRDIGLQSIRYIKYYDKFIPDHSLFRISHHLTKPACLQTFLFYVGIFLILVSRLPPNMMRPGSMTKGPGRRHVASGGAGGEDLDIDFDDVAGVDEAKEELQEIVVRG